MRWSTVEKIVEEAPPCPLSVNTMSKERVLECASNAQFVRSL